MSGKAVFLLGLAAIASVQLPVAHAAPSSWVHPGIFMNSTQLDYMKTKVAAGSDPWKTAYTKMLADPLASLTRTAAPVDIVQCGSYSIPDVGCTSERSDSVAAYIMSLAWYITGESAYSDKAIYYMDAWSATITGHNDTNAPLQSGWVASVWARAGEIVRYSNAGWPSSSISQFESMLSDVYLPEIIGGATNYNGNWELVMMEAALFVSVFTENATAYDKAMAKFLARVPAYIYLESDGAYPVAPSGSEYTTDAKLVAYWYSQTTFVNGLSQETCRDLEHTGYGVASISHVAETSRIQGRDLYKEDTGVRLSHALEFHTYYSLSTDRPSWLCSGALTGSFNNVTEVGHSEFVSRLGFTNMTNTTAFTAKKRPGGDNDLFVIWETLTHGRI